MAEVFRRLLAVLAEASRAIHDSHIQSAHDHLVLAQEAMVYLRAGLNHETGELATNLESLYGYIHGLLVRANLEKNTAPVEEAARLLGVLLEGWEKIEGGPALETAQSGVNA
jgi:flagellar protein FliS